MYIHDITIRNFSIHHETSLRLSPITVLIGPNGAGKSALFDALLNFSMLARGSIKQAFGHYPYSFAATKYRGAPGFARIGFDILMSETSDQTERLRYRINYAQFGPAESGVPSFHINNEKLETLHDNRVLFDRDNPDSSPLAQALQFVDNDYGILAAIRKAELLGGAAIDPLVSHCAREINRFNRFRLSPLEMARPSRLPDLDGGPAKMPYLGYEGEDLAACLYFMNETKHAALEAIIEKLSSIMPGFQGFEFNVVGVDKVAFSMTFSDSRGSVNAARMSHGNLILLGLMVLTLSPNRPPVMMIEEPENGLTPAAVKLFYASVRQLALNPEKEQRSQVLLSSHSPFVLCEAWNGNDKDFIHQFRIENGQSVVRKLSHAIKEQGVVLGKDTDGNRTILGLRNAEELMCGYYALGDMPAAAV